MDVHATRELICKISRLLFQRNLTDISGGNVSALSGKNICMTPSQAGTEFLWELEPHQILVIDQQGIKVDGEGEFSREFKVHFQLYREIPNGSAVIHCHAPNVMVFCAASLPLPPVLEYAMELGEIGFCDFLPADSPEFAASIVSEIRKKEQALASLAAAVMSPWHGLFVYGRTLNSAIDAVERIEANARTLLFSSLLQQMDSSVPGLAQRTAELKEEFSKKLCCRQMNNPIKKY